MRTVYTIGHSNRTFEDFADLLNINKIEFLVDVRNIARSRANPQFNEEVMAESLDRYNIGYKHIQSIGGHRGKDPDIAKDINGFWTHPAFHNYADYQLGQSWKEGFDQLLTIVDNYKTAYMCAEAVWWRCHRRMITDHLLLKGYNVLHIMNKYKPTQAVVTKGAVLKDNGKIEYPEYPEFQCNSAKSSHLGVG